MSVLETEVIDAIAAEVEAAGVLDDYIHSDGDYHGALTGVDILDGEDRGR